MSRPASFTLQMATGAGIVVIGGGFVIGSMQISSEAGYSGIGPNFMPAVVGAALAVCGLLLMWQAANGGYRAMEAPTGASRAHWRGWAWVTAALLANAALITTIGFILSCALCFAFTMHALEASRGESRRGVAPWLSKFGIGAAIAAPVFWMFTQLLAINLPGLTSTGWI